MDAPTNTGCARVSACICVRVRVCVRVSMCMRVSLALALALALALGHPLLPPSLPPPSFFLFHTHLSLALPLERLSKGCRGIAF